MKRFAYLVSTFVLAGCTSAVTTSSSAGRASVNADRISADVRTVSADAFLGRGPATRGEDDRAGSLGLGAPLTSGVPRREA